MQPRIEGDGAAIGAEAEEDDLAEIDQAGIAELDFRKEGVCNLAYFGLMPEYVGRGLGFFFLAQAVEMAWSRPIQRFTVNTCTLDHRRALPLYQRVGFVPYSREERYIDLP